MEYRIWQYAVNYNPLPGEAPLRVNYKTDLTQRLHPERTVILGEMTKVVYYAEFDGVTYSVPVVQEDFVYTRDPATGLASHRTLTISWFLEDDTLGSSTKDLTKFYTSIHDKRQEAFRKRSNQVDKASELAVYGQVLLGTSVSDATTNGQVLFKQWVPEIQRYQDSDTQPLIDNLTNDTTSWLDGAPAQFGGATIRQAMLAEI